ncbi:flagellar hook-associated protein FlgL [Azonexus sp.]|jgi:flagellar hook-associated protein 3 FlgL|uniref:flagellar hook-associated protein FlgL n=1 Tax=Azonexus sp. TaxID=1872668 RepID=UPI0028374876|nr:flagellar hook-associated protein FlgL [Azonexus sp.]MDR1995064.1 flagellar hook-associated protein FlgL [Azonexus sp.]
MRLSTSQIFNSGTTGMQNLQYGLYKIQQQMSSGRRILSPADDPIGATQALQVTQSKGINEQFLKNIGEATSKLNLLDSTLSGVEQELQVILERAVQAGNASLSDEQRGMIAEELRQRMSSLISLGNTKDGTGLYIFAGFKSATQPFQVDPGATPPYSLASGTHVGYSGDGGVETLQVSGSRTIATSENGLGVFMQVRDAQGNPTGRSMFDSLQNMIDILDPASGIPFTTAAYEQALGDTNASVAHLSTVRASVGARLQSLDSMATTANDSDYLYKVRLSELQDLDYYDAASQLAQLQLQLEAAQLSFKQTSQLSLFNIL